MELLLNIVWLAIVGAGVSVLLRKWSRVERNQFYLATGALLCAAILLWPVISVTDDLHQQAFIAEDASATKKMASVVAQVHPIVATFFGFTLFALTAAASRRKMWRTTVELSSPYRNPFSIRPLLGRAPPLISVL